MSHLTVEGTNKNYQYLLDNGISAESIRFLFWQQSRLSWPDFVWDWAVRLQKGAR